MADKTRKITASSSWRDSVDEAKRDCNRVLDIKVEDAIGDEEHDGWYLVSASYSSYSIDHNESRAEYKCTRSKTLKLREYDQDRVKRETAITISAEIIEAAQRGNTQLAASLMPTCKSEAVDEIVQAIARKSVERVPEPSFTEVLIEKVRPHVPATVPVISGGSSFYAPLEAITLESVKIVESTLKLGETEELIGLPLSETITIMPIDNCGKGITASFDFKWEYTHTTGFRVELSQELTESTEITGSLSFEGLGDLGGKFSREVKFSESREYSSSSEERRSRDIHVAVDADVRGTVRMVSQLFEARRSFSGPVTIEATVVARYFWGRTLQFELSKFLSKSQRTIDTSGHYHNLDTRVQPFTVDYLPCP